MGKKGKKGKGGDVKKELVTTRHMLKERERCMCPRLGDAYTRTDKAEDIKMDVVYFKMRRAVVKETTLLDLSRASLGFVPSELGEPKLFANITELDLSRNQLFNSEHVFGILANLSVLRELNLSDNFLNGPLSERATELKHLEVLNLDVNQLTGLPDSLGGWKELRSFSAADNEIAALPNVVGEWKKVTYVNLRNNKIRELPGSIGRWHLITRLYLGNNQLVSIPHEMGSLASLQELDLRNNLIAELPMTLSACVELQKLHLGNNKIVEVPAELLGAITKVEELHLYKNKIESLPPELGCLIKCHRMTLSSNNLKTLPDEIEGCVDLKELYLNNNAKFGALPTSAGHLQNLRELQAKKCPSLKSLPVDADWPNLQELDLRAAKKQVCKLPAELVTAIEAHCIIRGGVQKKGGKKGKGKK